MEGTCFYSNSRHMVAYQLPSDSYPTSHQSMTSFAFPTGLLVYCTHRHISFIVSTETNLNNKVKLIDLDNILLRTKTFCSHKYIMHNVIIYIIWILHKFTPNQKMKIYFWNNNRHKYAWIN